MCGLCAKLMKINEVTFAIENKEIKKFSQAKDVFVDVFRVRTHCLLTCCLAPTLSAVHTRT